MHTVAEKALSRANPSQRERKRVAYRVAVRSPPLLMAALKNPRRERFCQFLTADPNRNATAAARRAGYEGKAVRVVASRLLRCPDVATRLTELSAVTRVVSTQLTTDANNPANTANKHSRVVSTMRVNAQAIISVDWCEPERGDATRQDPQSFEERRFAE